MASQQPKSETRKRVRVEEEPAGPSTSRSARAGGSAAGAAPLVSPRPNPKTNAGGKKPVTPGGKSKAVEVLAPLRLIEAQIPLPSPSSPRRGFSPKACSVGERKFGAALQAFLDAEPFELETAEAK